MNILADHHQADLTWSLHLLAKRLGAILYTPYGINWFDEGYYRLYEHPRKKDPSRWLAKQYLEDVFYLPDKTIETQNGCLDYPRINLLTLEKAKDIQIDIVICSVNENQPYFAKLKEFYPKAKFIRQIGNQLDMNTDENLYPNLLASATAPYDRFSKHKVIYRQEFDMNLFKYRPLYNFNNIYSFQNDLEEDEDAWELWLRMKHGLLDFNFKSYGVGNHDGKIFPKRTYVERMLDSTFVFQRKFSEGYGHVVHNAFALGRIMILNSDTYLKGIAAPLLEDGKTCLFLESDWRYDTFSKIDLEIISENAHNRFLEVVNFDDDFIQVKKFFENLL